jgi:hypothetical protein
LPGAVDANAGSELLRKTRSTNKNDPKIGAIFREQSRVVEATPELIDLEGRDQ